MSALLISVTVIAEAVTLSLQVKGLCGFLLTEAFLFLLTLREREKKKKLARERVFIADVTYIVTGIN